MKDAEFLQAMVEYVECREAEGRTVEELKAQDAMPPLYAEAKRRLEEVQ